MNLSVFQKARRFIYQNARPLDLALWQYFFENGTKEAVLTALAFYQNEDGGFGHALENDCWNPNSSPIQTWVATSVLKEINFGDNSHPIVRGILKYLSSGADFDGHFWFRTIPSNNEYPHAPWWQCDKDFKKEQSYNPTASLAGFIVNYANENQALYKNALKIIVQAVNAYLDSDKVESHALACYIQLMEYCDMAKISNLFDGHAFRAKLIKDVHNSIKRDTTVWATKYICKPSSLFNSPSSIFYADNKDIADYECVFIEETQLDNGAWATTWRWNEYPNEYAISANWWQARFAILNMIYLENFGKLTLPNNRNTSEILASHF